jgi:hypothetical protein
MVNIGKRESEKRFGFLIAKASQTQNHSFRSKSNVKRLLPSPHALFNESIKTLEK